MMYCKYAREAMEMYCILSQYREINLCWNIDDRMKKCRYFHEEDKDGWMKYQHLTDAEFIKNENIAHSK